MSTGLAKDKTMTNQDDKILVNVCLLSLDEVDKAFEKPSFSSHQDQKRCENVFSKILQRQSSLLSLEEVFKEKQEGEKDPHKVVASGGAGCGKSVCFARRCMTGPLENCGSSFLSCFALSFETIMYSRQEHTQTC